MITLYSGTPGSGKSLHAAATVKQWLRRGRPVVTNYEINLGMVRHPECYLYVPNDRMSPDVLIEVAGWWRDGKPVREGSILLVIDEAQLLYNARQWQQTDSRGWVAWYTQHRKYGYDVILIAQFDRMLDRQIRSLIEYEYIHRKVSNYGIFGRIMALCVAGRLYAAVKRWYPIGERVATEWIVARPGLYRLYDTYATW